MKYEKITAHSQIYSVIITNSRAEALRKSSQEQATARVYDNGFIGTAGQIGPYDAGELFKRAQDKLSAGIPYPCMLGHETRKEDAFKHIIQPARFLPEIKELLFRLRESCPDFIFSNRINLRESEKHYTNSEGAQLDYRGNSINFSIVIKDKNSSNIMDGSYNCLTDFYDGEGVIKDIVKFTQAYKKQVELPERELPVILDLSLIGMFINDFSGERYAAGAGILRDKLHKKTFSENFSLLLDSRSMPHTCFFDAEGTVKEKDKFYLVKEGAVSGMLTTKRTADKYGLPLSGSAAAAFDGVPYAGMGGLTLGKKALNIADILKGQGIFVAMSSGGDMTGSGDIGMPVQLAFLYEDGELIGRLPELMLSGNIFEILNQGFIGCAQTGPFCYSEEPVIACRMNVGQIK